MGEGLYDPSWVSNYFYFNKDLVGRFYFFFIISKIEKQRWFLSKSEKL